MSLSEGPHSNVIVASQIVRDVKVGGGKERERLSKETAGLRTGLRDKSYIPGDKLTCEFRPLQLKEDGCLEVEIYGGMLRGSDSDNSLDPHFHHNFHLDLKTPLTIEQVRSLSLEDLLVRHCNDVTVDDGGNAENMVLNMGLSVVSALRQKINLIVFSSSDPLKRLSDDVRDKVQPYLQFYQLPNITDRIAIHFPWKYDNGKKGTFGLTTEPADTTHPLHTLFKTRNDLKMLVRSADTLLTCDPSFLELRTHGTPARYVTIANAATKWRTTIAGLGYGTDIILPMNHKEAADVTHVIKHVGREEELHKVQRVSFPPPLQPNGNDISEENLRQLDGLLLELTRYNHPHHRLSGEVAFNYPITFEEQGGIVVGTRNRRSFVVFTSTPDEVSEKRLLDQYGNADEMKTGDIETMGAGDAAASIIAIFNSIDPQEFIESFLEGRETTNTLLHQFAQTILASAMSRIFGSFLVHTKRTHIANIDHNKLGELFHEVALASLNAARVLVSHSNEVKVSDLKNLGMKAVTWNLGSVVNPEQEGLSA